ncbi:MAG TPA: lysylphosphatidylglycerol synthase transmembrane domain-containing protein [Pyrinomonadaceae bacterium]|jgi:hypothetical protein|nr:lysylphosphatidylglycerol synthase transmembrane domain-containing protein [Pyrinomonadaceae bacterium]
MSFAEESIKNKSNGGRRKFTPLGVIVVIAGLLLFLYFIKSAGVAQIATGIRNLGFGFLLILAISSIRQIVRSFAWMLSVEGPHRLRFSDAFRARVMSDAIGNILPFASFIVSEPAKPALIRDRLPLMAGFSSMVVENIFYSISIVIFISCGMVAVLLNFSQAKGLRLISTITLALICAAFVVGAIFIWAEVRFVSGIFRRLSKKRLSPNWFDRARRLEDRVYGFYRRNRARFLPILLLEGSFHLAGVAEIYVTLLFISPQHPPTIFSAFILESVNRLITMVFKFVPLRLGVDEAGTGKVSELLHFTEPAGVTLAIIRKARDLCWAVLGIGFLAYRQFAQRTGAVSSPVESIHYSTERMASHGADDVEVINSSN